MRSEEFYCIIKFVTISSAFDNSFHISTVLSRSVSDLRIWVASVGSAHTNNTSLPLCPLIFPRKKNDRKEKKTFIMDLLCLGPRCNPEVIWPEVWRATKTRSTPVLNQNNTSERERHSVVNLLQVIELTAWRIQKGRITKVAYR